MDSNAALKGAADPTPPEKPDLRQRVQSLRLPDDDELTGSRRSWLLWLVVLAIVVGGGYFAYVETIGKKSDADDATPSAASSPSIDSDSNPASPEASKPSRPSDVASSGEIAHESKGYIIPAHQIRVSPKVPGMLTMLNIEEGQRVQKDEILAEIESVEYEADYQRAEANVAAAMQRLLELERGFRAEEIAQAVAELQEAEAQRTQLYAEWKRIAQLRRSNVATQSEYDLAEANFKTTDRRVERLRKAHELIVAGPRIERIEAARADLALAKADLAKSKWRLDNCTVRAPVSGTILKKDAEVGNLVNPIAFAGSLSLCDMADLSDLEVELKIQERDVSKVFKGQKCEVRAEAWPDRLYEGYVDRLMPIADRSQGAIPVRVKVRVPAEEEGVYLKPQMGAVVTFLKGDETPER